MLNTVYQLVAPRRFEVTYENIGLQDNDVIVRPTHLSICNADQRYYQGLREDHILREKLPMALIHEAIGTVLRDPTGQFKPGDEVVMIPNTPVEEDEFIAENYLRSSKFRASGFNGFMQEYVKIRQDRLVMLPEEIDKEVAAFTEIVSVSVHALSRFDRFAHGRRDVVGIWGMAILAISRPFSLRPCSRIQSCIFLESARTSCLTLPLQTVHFVSVIYQKTWNLTTLLNVLVVLARERPLIRL